jgi:hypothetical protein
MLGDGALSFKEFAMREPLPLATIHGAVLEFLRGRKDAVLFGAQAVNAYVDEPRMTQDIDLMSIRAAALAEEIRSHLADRFSIAARVRDVRGGVGFRVYQLQEPKNRHLVDIRSVAVLPESGEIEGLLVLSPPELIATKIIGLVHRDRTPKGATDLADLRRLLLTFPELKAAGGLVESRLRGSGASHAALAAWQQLVEEEIRPGDEDDI